MSESTFNMKIGAEGESGTLRGKFPSSLVALLGGSKGDVINLVVEGKGRNARPISLKLLTGRAAEQASAANRPTGGPKKSAGNGGGGTKLKTGAKTPAKASGGGVKVKPTTANAAPKKGSGRKTEVEYQKPRTAPKKLQVSKKGKK